MVKGSPGAREVTSGVMVTREEVRWAWARGMRAMRARRVEVRSFLAFIEVVGCGGWGDVPKLYKKPQGRFPAAFGV